MIDWNRQLKLINRKKTIIKEIKSIIVNKLMIDIDPKLIQNDEPLIGRGLGLDSIDAMQLSISISTKFHVEMNNNLNKIFGSINKIADYIIKEQDKREQNDQ